ncbi:MAG: isoprenylcysteine carboxylmethyltransferase family protein [bacterium]
MADAAPTPWVFRYRSLLIGLAFGASAGLGELLGRLAFFDQFVGTLSLPAHLLLYRPSGLAGPAWPLAVPIAFGVVGAAIRFWGTSYLRGHVMADREMHSDRLIIAGPFRYVRNPLYVGNLFIAVAFGAFYRPPALVLAVAFMALVLSVVAAAEARGLRARHGASYDAYAKEVHAFVPTFRPAAATADIQPDWLNGLTSEAWGALIPAYLAAVTLRNQNLGLAILAVVVAGLLYRKAVNRRARAVQP